MFEEQINLKYDIENFNQDLNQRNQTRKKKCRLLKTQKGNLLEGNQKVLNGFEREIFPIGKQTPRK